MSHFFHFIKKTLLFFSLTVAILVLFLLSIWLLKVVQPTPNTTSINSSVIPQTSAQFQALSAQQLDDLFNSAQRNKIPSGIYEGKPLLLSGTTFGAALGDFVSLIFWNGKVFWPELGKIANRVGPLSSTVLEGNLRMGRSRSDGELSVIVSYENSSFGPQNAGDEIRWLGGNVFLGQGFINNKPGMYFYLIGEEPISTSSRQASTVIESDSSNKLVTKQSIVEANNNPDEWLSHGRTYDEQRFSPLKNITKDNIAGLGLAWSYDLPTNRGVEATPLISNGVMYTTGSWSIVYALDAKTGELLWQFDPQVPKDYTQFTCCGPVNRGAALWGDKVYVATLDGRLIAVNRTTGLPVWTVDTLINKDDPYSITGAPRIINGKVIIGNGGAEMGVRGYVSAFDAETGEFVWRFFTVPGNPADGFEDETQEWIAKTWTGKWWENGKGGGTAWDSFAFDPELNLLYIGVGNGSSWNQKIRSPDGGDNLFLSSIVAVNADTGSYVWHYQTTPGDSWDFTATQHMVLAELELSGKLRKVIMQAPKNGFFYVIDRATGELLSAKNYADVNWASAIDMKTGRPIENPQARSGSSDFTVMPGSGGAHNWHPMSFSPDTGYVYIPSKESGHAYSDDLNEKKRKTIYNLNYSTLETMSVPDFIPTWVRMAYVKLKARATLIAWDPVKGQEVWRQDQGVISSGGVLSTAGNLVFQGNIDGLFSAFDAQSGEQLWSYKTDKGIMASPISYRLDGEQYIAVMQGWGGAAGLAAGVIAGPMEMANVSRIIVFKLGGRSLLTDVEFVQEKLAAPSLPEPTEVEVESGRKLYYQYCIACHGSNAVSGGVVPDLRFSVSYLSPAWNSIVIDGAFKSKGMPSWKEYLTKGEAQLIKSYVVHEATLGHGRGEIRVRRQ